MHLSRLCTTLVLAAATPAVSLGAALLPLTDQEGAAVAAVGLPFALGQRQLGTAQAEARWQRHPSLEWTELALAAIQKYRLNPLRAARMLAHLHAALHDAWEACSTAATAARCSTIAQHVAAGQVLEHFFPEEVPGRFMALAVSALASVDWRDASSVDREAAEHGQRAAWAANLRSMRDGADRPLTAPQRPAPAPGIWRPTPPLFALNATEQSAPAWRTWTLKNAAELQVPPPLQYGSPQYLAEVLEVLQVSQKLGATQKRIAEDWNLDLGTATPAGVWNRHAMRFVEQYKLDPAATTRFMTAMNFAMADAFIACWHTKLLWWTERPITEVRARLDSNFEPHIVTPPFPGYVSGHATASGAAAAVIEAHVPAAADHAMRLAEEAALSRLYGGIHFRHDNEQGLRLGIEIGRLAVRRLAGAGPAQTHANQSTNR